MINPYLLRRMKSDVQKHLHLPEKNEQVGFRQNLLMFSDQSDHPVFLYCVGFVLQDDGRSKDSLQVLHRLERN